jgi:flagellar basal body rod protein FlgC
VVVLNGLMIAAAATARSGLLASIARLNAGASKIAGGSTAGARPEIAAPLAGGARVDQPVDLAEEAVGILEAALLFKANLAVLKTADEMTKTMLDRVA